MDNMRLPSEIELLKISANTYSSVAIASERMGGGEGESLERAGPVTKRSLADDNKPKLTSSQRYVIAHHTLSLSCKK